MGVVVQRSGSRCHCQVSLTKQRTPRFIWRRSRRAFRKLIYPPPKLLRSWSLNTRSTNPAIRSRSPSCRHRCLCCYVCFAATCHCGRNANSVCHASCAARGSLAASDAAASLCAIVWLILICVCYVIVYIRTEDNLYILLPGGKLILLPGGKVKITLENPTPLLAHPDRGWSRCELVRLHDK